MKKILFALSVGALAAAAPSRAVAQNRLVRRWEIPGFDFSPNGAFRQWARAVAARRAAMLSQGNFGALNAPVAMGAPVPSPAAVSGTVQVPAVLFKFKNSTLPGSGRDTTDYTSVLFGASAPLGRPFTVRTFYEQLSNGLLSIQGRAIGYATLDSNEVTYTGVPPCSGVIQGSVNCNGLFSYTGGQPGLTPQQRMQRGLYQALHKVDSIVGPDWSQFDYDPATGILALVIFIQPAQDGACGGSSNNHLWSHRFELLNFANTAESLYVTKTAWPGHAGQFLKIRDYTLQSGVGGTTACDSTAIMPVGTASHETGHAFGLPDLYDTQGTSEGIGEWGLMGSGNYTTASSPTRMEAWSLQQLGWTTIVPITTNGTYTIGAADLSHSADTAFYVRVKDPNPRGEYYLLENREASLADSAVIRYHCLVSGQPGSCDGGGLAVWHIDSEQVVNAGITVSNTVNSGPIHGVNLLQADGLDQLLSGTNRGDAGDLFPSPVANNPAIGINTNPASVKNVDGSFAGFVIDSIRKLSTNGPVAFRVRFGGLTSVQSTDAAAFISVDGTPYHTFQGLFDSGSVHTVAVADTQFRVSDSLERWIFSSWSDAGAASHSVVGSFAGDSLTATLIRAFRVKATILAGGTATSNPPGVLTGAYFAPSTAVSVTAHPTGSNIFLGWSGDTTAADTVLALTLSRPFAVTANFSAPLQLAAVLQQLFTGSSTLSAQQINYLDANGNKSGGFSVDVGDFLAWVRATHAVPAAPPAPGSQALARLPRNGGRP